MLLNPTWLYVAAVYALAIWLTRRAGIDLSWRSASFFYLLVLVFMLKPLTGPWVNVPIDIVHTLPPWLRLSHVKGASNGQLNDVVLQIIPFANQAREALRSFTLPLWNSMNGCGYPLLANGQSAPFSIIRLIALPLPLAWAITAEAAFNLLVAQTFMYLLVRRRGYAELPSAIGAVCFGFCTFLHLWLHFPLGTAAAFFPAAVYSIDLLAETITYRRFVFSSLLWAAMLYSGHPETVSHATFFCGLYLLWIVFVEQRASWRRAIGKLAGVSAAIACGALIAMPFIAPLVEALPRSKRYQQLLAWPHGSNTSDWASRIVLLEPGFFGHVPLESPWGSAASAEGLGGAVGILAAAAVIALALRAIALRRFRDRELFFVLATIFFLGAVLGWPGVSQLVTFIFKFAANARLRLVLCFLGAVQTAAAIDLVRRERAWPYLTGIAVAATALLLLINFVHFPSEMAKSTAVIAILPSMAVLALAAMLPLAARHQHQVTLLLAVAIIAELFNFNVGWNPDEPIEMFYPKTPLIETLEKLKDTRGPSDPFRIVGLGAAMFPNLNAMYGFEDVRTHDPMANGRYLGMLRVHGDYDPNHYFATWDQPNSRMLDFLNVRYVVADIYGQVEDPQRFEKLYDGPDGRIFLNHDAQPRFFAVQNILLEFNRDHFNQLLAEQKDFRDTCVMNKLPVSGDAERTDLLAPRPVGAPVTNVTIQDSTPTDFRVHVSAPRYTMIASSIASWPGWHVSANRKSLRPLEINGAFLGFVVPPGENEIRVWYAPWSFRIGVIVMVMTLVALFVWRRRPGGGTTGEVAGATLGLNP